MTKKRKISEIHNDMDKINKRKPSQKDLDELAEIIKREQENDNDKNSSEDLSYQKIATS